MENKTPDKQYWDSLYQNHDTGWDIGYPSPALQAYIDQLTEKNKSILIPGCGNSYEAEYLLRNGFTDVTLVDISPSLTATLESKFAHYLGRQLKIITGDFFDLGGHYDLIFEQTFLSALHPSLRIDYINKMHELLKPAGKLVGMLFSCPFEGGPPFGGSKDEYEKLFKEKFKIKLLEPCYNSIERRKGSEVFFIISPKT
jgi:SAM-dependent methyltransferase